MGEKKRTERRGRAVNGIGIGDEQTTQTVLLAVRSKLTQRELPLCDCLHRCQRNDQGMCLAHVLVRGHLCDACRAAGCRSGYNAAVDKAVEEGA